MSHCLSSRSYFTLSNKIKSSKSNHLYWNFDNSGQKHDIGMPNIIVFPFSDFEITLTGSRIEDNKNRFISKVFTDLEKTVNLNDCYVRVSTDELDLLLKVMVSPQTKK